MSMAHATGLLEITPATRSASPTTSTHCFSCGRRSATTATGIIPHSITAPGKTWFSADSTSPCGSNSSLTGPNRPCLFGHENLVELVRDLHSLLGRLLLQNGSH